jgi:hypothetical protein
MNIYKHKIGLFDAQDEDDAKEKMAKNLIPHPDFGENNYKRKCKKREDDIIKTKQFITAMGVDGGYIDI